jgi:hypothetical protein
MDLKKTNSYLQATFMDSMLPKQQIISHLPCFNWENLAKPGYRDISMEKYLNFQLFSLKTVASIVVS